MQLRALHCVIIALSVFIDISNAQITTFPYSENFDGILAPALPAGWSIDGFVDTTSTTHSSPNCLLAKGNMLTKTIVSPAFDFSNRIPDKLVFYEYRSNTAKYYRLEIRASTDGVNFTTLLVRFDSSTSLSSYIQRSIDLNEAGLQQQLNVRFRWQLLGDNTNNTGILRFDDVSLTVAAGFDLGFSGMNISPARATRNDLLSISAVVKNYGPFSASGFSVRFFYDENFDAIAEHDEQISVGTGYSINPGDSLTFTTTYQPVKAGEHHFIAAVDFPQDENRTNDTADAISIVKCLKGDLLINEIMYDPLDGQNEWIELYNRSSFPIGIKEWFLHDRPTAVNVNKFVIHENYSVPPQGLIVLANDSSILKLFSYLGSPTPMMQVVFFNRPSLSIFNNDGDDVVLADLSGQIVDSVAYSPHWHHPDVGDTHGRSLERINPNVDSNDPRNWSTCTDPLGGTPGKANSIFTAGAVINARISISPNPFSPDGDGFEDFCIIRYNLPMTTSTLKVRIYDIKGRCIRTLANSELAGSRGDIIWDGYDENKQRARIGVYIVFLEATDRSTGRIEAAKAVAVVATKL